MPNSFQQVTACRLSDIIFITEFPAKQLVQKVPNYGEICGHVILLENYSDFLMFAESWYVEPRAECR
jgi:hypothetical protein